MKVAVVQPLPGIGDMIWHLPHIQAIADYVGEPVSVVTKPRSAADQLFCDDPSVQDVIWLDRNPDEVARAGNATGAHDGIGLFRMAAQLRARRFDAVYLLHHSKTLAALTRIAQIPARFGYGAGIQKLFLNRPPFLTPAESRLTPFEQATTWLRKAQIPVSHLEPRLTATPTRRAAIARELTISPNDYVAIGIGSSEPYKQWGEIRFAALVAALLDVGIPKVVLVGGKTEATLADAIRSRVGARAERVIPMISRPLPDVIALFVNAAFYVGNDTGMMNLAAAAGVRTYCLFGATAPLTHSSNIVPIVPPGGVDIQAGMAAITVAAVLAAVAADRAAAGLAGTWLVQPD